MEAHYELESETNKGNIYVGGSVIKMKQSRFLSPTIEGMVSAKEGKYPPPISPKRLEFTRPSGSHDHTEAIEALHTFEKLVRTTKQGPRKDVHKLLSIVTSQLRRAMFFTDNERIKKYGLPIDILYADVVKGLEQQLEQGILGQVRPKCLELEMEFDQLRGESGHFSAEVLVPCLNETNTVKESIRQMKAASTRSQKRTDEALKDIEVIGRKANAFEQSVHEIRTRGEAFEYNIVAVKAEIYAVQDATTAAIRHKETLYTKNQVEDIHRYKAQLMKELELQRRGYADHVAKLSQCSQTTSIIDRKMIKLYEDQENSTALLYLMRDTHTPRPETVDDTVIEKAKVNLQYMKESLEGFVKQIELALTTDMNSGTNMFMGIFRNILLKIKKIYALVTRLSDTLSQPGSTDTEAQMDEEAAARTKGIYAALTETTAQMIKVDKISTLCHKALRLREEAVEYNEQYKAEKENLNNLAALVVSDEVRAKKYGAYSIKIATCRNPNNLKDEVHLGRVVGPRPLPSFLQVVGPDQTRLSDGDAAVVALKRFAQEEAKIGRERNTPAAARKKAEEFLAGQKNVSRTSRKALEEAGQVARLETISYGKLLEAIQHIHALQKTVAATVRWEDYLEKVETREKAERDNQFNGAAWEKNVLHIISVMEHKRKLHGHTIENTLDLFKEMDTDHSGFISRKEMELGMQELDLGLNSKDIATLVEHIHFDESSADGKTEEISYMEFAKALHGQRHFHNPLKSKTKTSKRKRKEKPFDLQQVVTAYFLQTNPDIDSTNTRAIGSYGRSLLYACQQHMEDARVATFYYILTCQVSQKTLDDTERMVELYKKHIKSLALQEGNHGKGIVYRQNLTQSLPRFFVELNDKTINKLKRLIDHAFPYHFVDVDALMTLPKDKEQCKFSFLNAICLLNTNAHRSYYFTFRDKVANTDAVGSKHIAAALIPVVLKQLDPWMPKEMVREYFAGALDVSLAELNQHIFNPPGESPTRFMEVSTVADNVLRLALFPSRFYEKDALKSRPVATIKHGVYDNLYSKKPLSEAEAIQQILRMKMVYNDGSKRKVLTVDENSNQVEMYTASSLIGYVSVAHRTPRAKKKAPNKTSEVIVSMEAAKSLGLRKSSSPTARRNHRGRGKRSPPRK